MSDMTIDFETAGFNAADVTSGRVHRRRPINLGLSKLGDHNDAGKWEWYGPPDHLHRVTRLEQTLSQKKEKALRRHVAMQQSQEKQPGFFERLRTQLEQHVTIPAAKRLEELYPAPPPYAYKVVKLNQDWQARVVEDVPEFEAYKEQQDQDDPMVDCPGSKHFPLKTCRRSQLGFARDMAGWKAPAVSEPVAPPKKLDAEPTFLYAPRTFDAKVWGDDKGSAFKSTVAAMSQPWDGRGP